MKAKDINNLLYNPKWTSKILHYFISGACDQKAAKLKFELIYFGLPFIFDDIIFEKLITSNKTSSISTLFKSSDIKNQIIYIPQKIESYKNITNQGLIYLGNKFELVINDSITINQTWHYNQEHNPIIKLYCKAAYNWGQIISKEDYKIIFMKFEISNI